MQAEEEVEEPRRAVGAACASAPSTPQPWPPCSGQEEEQEEGRRLPRKRKCPWAGWGRARCRAPSCGFCSTRSSSGRRD